MHSCVLLGFASDSYMYLPTWQPLLNLNDQIASLGLAPKAYFMVKRVYTVLLTLSLKKPELLCGFDLTLMIQWIQWTR